MIIQEEKDFLFTIKLNIVHFSYLQQPINNPEPLFVGLYICNYLVNCKVTEMSTDISITFLQSNQNLVANYLLNYFVGKVLWRCKDLVCVFLSGFKYFCVSVRVFFFFMLFFQLCFSIAQNERSRFTGMPEFECFLSATLNFDSC